MDDRPTNAVRRIAVATDFSAGARLAMARGVQLAQEHKARLDLVHVFDSDSWSALGRVFDLKRLLADIPADVALRQRLDTTARELARDTGLQVEPWFGLGEPAGAIHAYVEEKQPAVVVIARRSNPSVRGIGNTLLKVLREVACPMLVVSRDGNASYACVVSAIDLRDTSARAAAAAVALFPGAQHRLLCVLDPAWEREVWRGSGFQERITGQLAMVRSALQERIDGLVRDLQPVSSGRVQGELLEAVPSRAIVARARDLRAGCIALGRHGQDALTERLVGSTTLDVLHHARRDVLVVS